MVLVTRASSASASASAKRVRRAPSLPDFELEQLPRSAIRKKPRPKVPREKKKAAAKKVVVIDENEEEEEEEAREQLDAAVRALVGDLDAAVQAHEAHGLLCSDELFGPDGPEMTMPQFDPDLEPRVSGRTWTPDEDDALLSAIKEMGAKNWSVIANRLPGRIGKQCRERWHNHLNPEISKRAWTDAEDVIIQMGVMELGHKWSKIARRLTGRTDNDVKNRYNVRVKKLGGGATILEGPRISQEDFVHELVRRNVLAEEMRTPGRFSPNQIEALAAGNTEIVDTPGCRWSNDEHARLMHAIPEGALPNQIDWVKVSCAVPSRGPQSCRRHWVNYLRGGWKHAPFRGEQLEVEPSPLALLTDLDPEEGAAALAAAAESMVESMTEVVESMTTHSALLAKYADHPDLELMAIETYSEGSCANTWSKSSVLVVGKPGLSFRFHTPGTTAPLAAPPPENKDSEIGSGSQLETTALSKWLTQKAQEDKKASTERLEKLRVTLDAIAEKEREAKKNKKKSNAVNTVDTHFRTVKSTAKANGSTGAWSKERWLQGLQVEPAAPPLVAFAVPVQA